uniref:PKD domain-containing protein n=1 Tax=Cellulophaga baltica TaxID=76594 RepID=UPI00249425FD
VVGTYTVTYNVSDDAGNSATEVIRTVTVTSPPNQAPLAVAGADTNSGDAPLTVNFIGDESYDPNTGDVLSYLWDFDDNGATSIGINPTHTFQNSGNYNVTLTVTDNGTPILNDTATIIVSVDPGPSATFSGSTSVSTSQPSVTGTLTIENGAVSFGLSGYGGSGSGTSLTFTISGIDTWYLSMVAGQSGSLDTPLIPEGTYTYTLSGSFGGTSGNGGGVGPN